ncbi:hypothetical protein [Alkalimarinus alittae]|uniref:Late embryogenesis abundant protein LEA-2 subgroup domain-containing protein n=1 Tax=Alkalimarinus alittae TaxID=2961619 RepID=A0ABY6N518_9ALTE|nr:hypothetical protein [Alkalimarinus alittae]UZE97186.1 hypothetical protein NKI27_05410 [Alkalimarinus alittae]
MCEWIELLSKVNWSNWVSSLTTVAIFVLAIFQYRETKIINKIQKSLSAIDLTPSIDLQYIFSTGTLLIKNTGRSQLYFFALSTNTTGKKAQEITARPEGQRVIAINSSFPLKFDIELNKSAFLEGQKKDVALNGLVYISNLHGSKFSISLTVKLIASFSGDSIAPVIHGQAAWIEEMVELESFPWE